MNLSVIIPVLNEEKTISKIVKLVLKQKNVKEIIIVDDGSTDGTSRILSKINNLKIKIITHLHNKGKGSALRTAIKVVSQDYVLIQDADLEYNPNDFSLLLKSASLNTVIYGSRNLGKNKHAYTRTYIGNFLVTFFFNVLYNRRLTDSYTCYKLIPNNILKNIILESNGFEIEAEITAKLAKKGIKIIELPIRYSPRKYEQGKKIKTIDAIKGVLKYLTLRFS